MMRILTAFLFTLVTSINATSQSFLHDRTYYEEKFYSWLSNHSIKPLNGEDFVHFLENFISNDIFIETHNLIGNKTYTLGHNRFSHLNVNEWKSYISKGLIKPQVPVSEFLHMAPSDLSSLPDHVDWTEKGGVTDIKDQGQCGSCWSFSTTGALEGAVFAKTGKLTSLSEQNLVDCDRFRYGHKDMGCDGGLMDNAFVFASENGGLCAEDDYPYVSGNTTKAGSCNSKSCTKVPNTAPKNDKGAFTDVDVSDEALMSALVQQPVSVAIQADTKAFQLYSSGVFTAECGSDTDHGVLAVGYGSLDGIPYYKVKNSWGSSWGDGGYVYLLRGADKKVGQCGILTGASYPNMPDANSNLLSMQRQEGVPLRSTTSDYRNDQRRNSIDSSVPNSKANDQLNRKSYAQTDVSTSGPKASTRYQGRNKGSNKHYFESRHRQLDAVLLVVRNQTQARVAFTLTDINHAIATAGRMYRVADAMEIFHSLPLLGFKPDLMSYNNIIWAAGNSGDLDLAENIFSGLRFNGLLRPNAYTFGSLMHGCAKVKAVDRALAYLDEMAALGITPNQIVFTSAMEACAEKYKQALAVMHRIEAVGLKPDLTMVNSAIKACCLAGAMEEAEALAEGLQNDGSMDLFTYHTLMMGHTKLGAYFKVMQLYEQAIESNTQLDGGVYSLAMLSALNCGSFNTVKRIAEKAHDEHVELTEASYTILIQAFAELHEFEAAVKCLDDMTAEGLCPNAITYSAVIAASKDHPQVVMQLLDRMERENVTKNTVVLTAAINSLARSGEAYINRALAILESMEIHGPEPNIYTYNTITRALAEAGLLNEALALVERVRRKGLKPDRFTLTTLLIACGRTKSSDMVSRVIEAMALSGVPPDGIAFGAALDAHRRAENALGAVECLSQMTQYRVEPTASHYNLVVRALKSQGYTDRMFKMVLAISQKETAKSKINSNTFEIVIESMLEADKWKEAMILVQTMEKLDFKPSVQICVALVEKLERVRQYKSVMAMYKLMVRYEYDFYENGVLNLIFKRMITVATMDLDMKLGLQDIFQKIKARK